MRRWGRCRDLARVIAISATQFQIALAAPEYVGAKVCGGCHRDEAALQSSSAHAHALSRAEDHPLASSLALDSKLSRTPAYRFEFFRTGETLETRIFDGTRVMELPMEWAFGAGKQAVTFVTRVNKDWYIEHYASFYPLLRAWDATPGQREIQPGSLTEAAGRLYPTTDPNQGIAGCFECHSTGPVVFDSAGEPQVTELGVRCEGCHGPGAAHAKNPTRKNIRNPGNLSAPQLSQFCGTCHRAPAAAGQNVDWNYSWNVRHQPLYLDQSACFRKSREKLTCLTCHDPHEHAPKMAPAFYNQRCLGCHGVTASRPTAACQDRTPSNCIDCHMPLVSPQAGLRFTNHWIGIYADGAKLKPLR